MTGQNKDNQVVSSIQMPGVRQQFRNLPVEQRRYIQDLKGDEQPLMPLPPDPFEGVTYHTFHEARCSICSSPYRTQLEHVFLSQGESAKAVSDYFWIHYGVMVNPAAVKQHMSKHCVLTDITPSGLAQLQKRSEEFDWWKLRRNELVIPGLLSQIDRVEAIRTKGQPELELKKSAEMRALIAAYNAAQKQFEEEASEIISVQHILADIMNVVQDETSKEAIRQYVKSLRQKIRGEI